MVEWTRLEGGQVEAVVAMFVNRERPNSVRITPSRGDGGIDILDRGAGTDGGDVVYQVKRYTEKLTSKQKKDIEKSALTLAGDERWEGLTVSEWHLVMPWDPTPEVFRWLNELIDSAITTFWHGLTWVDQMAAKYPDIIDYYLHGGRSRVEQAYSEAMALVGATREDGNLSVAAGRNRLAKAVRALDHDPHYRYELQFGDGSPPDMTKADRPGLVMRCQGVSAEGPWTVVDVIARCAASLEERPIVIKGQFTAQRGSDFERDLQAFFTYGTPFSSPDGVFDGEVDAPGGLGGPLVGAQVSTFQPASPDLGSNPELRLEVLDAEGASIAAVDVHRVDRSQGVEGGLRVVFGESHGLFTFEDRLDFQKGERHRLFKFGDFTGQPVTVAYPAAKLLSALHSPNKMRLSVRHTPARLGVVDGDVGTWSQETQNSLDTLTSVTEMLSVFQEHSQDVILTPDLTSTTKEEFDSWQRTAALLRGSEIRGRYPEGHQLVVVLPAEVVLAEGQDLTFLTPLVVEVGQQRIELGYQECTLVSPDLISQQSLPHGVLHTFETPDRGVLLRRHSLATE